MRLDDLLSGLLDASEEQREAEKQFEQFRGMNEAQLNQERDELQGNYPAELVERLVQTGNFVSDNYA